MSVELNILQHNLNTFLIDNFNIEYKKSIVVKNLGNTIGARTILNNNTIELSESIYKSSFIDYNILNKVIFHEGIHLYLYNSGKEYKDNSKLFEHTLSKYKLVTNSPDSYLYGNTNNTFLCFYDEYIYTCSNCHKILYKSDYLYNINYTSTCCNAPILSNISNTKPIRVNMYI